MTTALHPTTGAERNDSYHHEALYETYRLPGKIHYTFSGHSHRAAPTAISRPLKLFVGHRL